MKNYLGRVYGSTFMSILGTLTIAKVASASAIAVTSPGTMMIGGFVLSIGGMFGFRASKYTIEQTEKNGYPEIYAKNSPMRLFWFSSIVTGMGLIMTPLLASFMAFNPYILPSALMLTGAICGGA